MEIKTAIMNIDVKFNNYIFHYLISVEITIFGILVKKKQVKFEK